MLGIDYENDASKHNKTTRQHAKTLYTYYANLLLTIN